MTGTPPLPNEDAFTKLRGKLVDAFARVEKCLVLAIHDLGGKPKNDTLTGKVKVLKSIGAAKLNKTALSKLDELEQLAKLRADFVHGEMDIVDMKGERFAIFRNARYAADPFQPATLLSHKQMREMNDKIGKIAEELSNLKPCSAAPVVAKPNGAKPAAAKPVAAKPAAALG